MKKHPEKLYHGSNHSIEGILRPTLSNATTDHIHSRPAIFATERIDLAALFMFPLEYLASIGFEEDIAYICIWGTRKEFKDINAGYIYELPAETFEKIGKEYEYQSFEVVKPNKVIPFDSIIDGMMECGVQVYFINDENIFDQIVINKEHRAPILCNLVSENEKLGIIIKKFSNSI